MGKYHHLDFESTTTHTMLCQMLKQKMRLITIKGIINELRMASAVFETLIIPELGEDRKFNYNSIPIRIDPNLPITKIVIGIGVDGIDRAIGRIK